MRQIISQPVPGFSDNYRIVHRGTKRHLVRTDPGTADETARVEVIETFDNEQEMNSFLDTFRQSVDEAIENKIAEHDKGNNPQ